MPATKLPPSRPQTNVMLSRVAHSLYWMSRYIERAEGVLRILRAWHARYAESANPGQPLLAFVSEYLSDIDVDTKSGVPESLLRNIDSAVYSASNIRDRFSPDGWLALNDDALAERARPLRLCYAGQVVTIKGDGLDPTRERLQLGAELIGSDSVAAAGEIVAAAIEALSAAGATGLSVDFTLPDLVDTLAANALPLDADRIEAVRRELDAKDAGGLVEAGGEAYLPLLAAIGPFDAAIERLAAFDAGGVLAERIAALREVAARLAGKARLTLDPSERHGFEYQSWFGFTIYADGLSGALGRGGSYRILGPDEPAIGFSLFPDALIDRLAAAEPAVGQGQPPRRL